MTLGARERPKRLISCPFVLTVGPALEIVSEETGDLLFGESVVRSLLPPLCEELLAGRYHLFHVTRLQVGQCRRRGALQIAIGQVTADGLAPFGEESLQRDGNTGQLEPTLVLGPPMVPAKLGYSFERPLALETEPLLQFEGQLAAVVSAGHHLVPIQRRAEDRSRASVFTDTHVEH